MIIQKKCKGTCSIHYARRLIVRKLLTFFLIQVTLVSCSAEKWGKKSVVITANQIRSGCEEYSFSG